MSTLYVNNIEPVSGSTLTLISASLIAVDNLTVTSLTSSFKGNLQGTASFATTASHALNTTPPSGVAGAIQFSNGSAFASDASNLFWDDTNNRLGIGTNAPTASLQIDYASSTLNGILINQTGGTSNFSNIGFANNGTIRSTFGMNLNSGEVRWFNSSGGYFATIYGNGVEAMRIDGSQNVNIGATALGARVGIKGSGSTSATTSLLVQNSAGTQTFKVDDGGNVQIGSTNGGVTFNAGYNNAFLQNQLSFYSTATNIRGINAGGQGLIISKTSGTTDLYPTALLAIDSTTQGFLPPRMTTTQRDAIATPATGLKIYNTTLGTTDTYDGATWQRFGQQTFIKGSGATSATTSLLVQNSAGTAALTITDNRNATFGADLSVTGALNVTQDVGLSNTVIYWGGGYQIRNTANGIVFTGAGGSATGALGLGMTVGTGINASAILQADSTTKGFLPPRMTTTQKNAIASPAAGLMVYDTTLNQMSYFNSSSWVNL